MISEKDRRAHHQGECYCNSGAQSQYAWRGAIRLAAGARCIEIRR
jgi:hypothetical protein